LAGGGNRLLAGATVDLTTGEVVLTADGLEGTCHLDGWRQRCARVTTLIADALRTRFIEKQYKLLATGEHANSQARGHF